MTHEKHNVAIMENATHIFCIVRCDTLDDVKELGQLVSKLRGNYHCSSDEYMKYGCACDYIVSHLPDKYEVCYFCDYVDAY